MTEERPGHAASGYSAVRMRLEPWFNLVSDQAAPADIDASIRAGVPFQGTNLWILVCATFVASIGLNMNSAAVIIGAMLISPLMGPIMGIGYGAGVNDIALIHSSAKNLAVAVVFSLLTSALYFLLTPLSEARSEILARTSPTIWDVLIALFGGLAGIIGSTRREKSNVIPGVAIATALMPPLCTAGFGIATWQPYFVLGAMYLFAINSVFIAAASFIMVRQMRLPEVTRLDEPSRARTRKFTWLIVVLTVIPSVYLAYRLVQKEVFVSRAERFVLSSFPNDGGTFVVGRDLDLLTRTIRLNVIGEAIPDDALLALEQSLASHKLVGARLEIVQSRRDEVDVESLGKQVAGDLYRDTLLALDEKTRQIAGLEQQLASATEAKQRFGDIIAELRASYPQIIDLGVGLGTTSTADGTAMEALLVTMVVAQPFLAEESTRIEAWLKVRTKIETVDLSVMVEPPTPPEPAPQKAKRGP